jgi:regulatory Fis family protein
VTVMPGTKMSEIERAVIEAALKETKGNRRRAAEMLGIGERTFAGMAGAKGSFDRVSHPPRKGGSIEVTGNHADQKKYRGETRGHNGEPK